MAKLCDEHSLCGMQGLGAWIQFKELFSTVKYCESGTSVRRGGLVNLSLYFLAANKGQVSTGHWRAQNMNLGKE